MSERFLYEGKAKKIYQTADSTQVRLSFKDDATAFDGTKKGSISAKGSVNAQMSAIMFAALEKRGIPTHFIEKLSNSELICQKVDIILIEVVVRNVAAGSICKRLGFEKGTPFEPELVEFFYKEDALHDPLITDDHVLLLNLATAEEMTFLKDQARKVNKVLVDTFKEVGIQLVDFKLEFGRNTAGEIILADEISPDTCRLWDINTGKVLDKDRFRWDMGDIEAAYQEVLSRIGGVA